MDFEAMETYVDEVYDAVLEKCAYGDEPEALNQQERTLFLVLAMVNEVNNGGFGQYFGNSTGDDAPEALKALRTIGADFLAGLLEKAMSAFGDSYPSFDQRNDLMDGMEDDSFALWTECEDAFYGEDDGEWSEEYQHVIGCCHAFIMKNRDALLTDAPQEAVPAETDAASDHDIWEIQNPADLVVIVNDAVLEKCGYGENVSALTAQERLFYLVQCLWMEINNGGFCQYFDNSSGDDAPETLAALRTIGADFVVALMEKAMAQFGAAYPTNRQERLDLTADWADDDPRIVLWWECDNAFYQDQKGDACLNACCYAYLMKNRDGFQV